MHFLSLAMDIVLSVYLCVEIIRFLPRYRRLKQEIAQGDPEARTRLYRSVLVFEWISAFMALVALRFDWTKLNPKTLALEGTRIVQVFSISEGAKEGVVVGMISGVVIGGIAFAIGLRRKGRRGAAQPSASSGWRSRMLPDFTALIPVTRRERFLYAAVAVSAGICEEIVFRGWLLATLHSRVGLTGTTLIVIAAAIFGAAHVYQKATGVILTALAGLLFCGLYIATGSLLIPIVFHILVDIRFAFMPAPAAVKPQAAYA
jgi:uncharacterized protein